MTRFLPALLLAGCTTLTPVYAPDGKPAYMVECGGSVARCHNAAREQCRGAYTPLDEQRASGAFGTTSGMIVPTHRYALTFRCH